MRYNKKERIMAGASSAQAQLLEFFRGVAIQIKTLEAQASHALSNGYDTEGHAAALKAKCQRLQALPEEVAPLCKQVDAACADMVQEQVTSMARRAGQAMSVGSVFYMACLLYPDDYVEGQQTELEEFIEELEAMLMP